MSYEITQDCEIMNCSFEKGDIVDEAAVQFYPTVMKKSGKESDFDLVKVGDVLTKKEKKAEAKAKSEAPKKEKKAEAKA